MSYFFFLVVVAKSNGRKGLFCLTLIHIVHRGREVMVTGACGRWSYGIRHQAAETGEPMGQCYSSSEQLFLLPLSFSGNALIDLLGIYFCGDPKSYQVGNQG